MNEAEDKSERRRQLFIRNLSYDITEETLTKLFEDFGPLKNVSITRKSDGSSAGFGFVKFAFEDDATAALNKLNSTYLNGRQIRLEYFQKKGKESQTKQSPEVKESSDNESLAVEEEQEDETEPQPSSNEESSSIRKTRQILVFGVPIDINKKIMKSVLTKLSRHLIVELIKEENEISKSAEVIFPVGKVFMLTAASRKEAQKVLEVLNSTNLRNLGFAKFTTSEEKDHEADDAETESTKKVQSLFCLKNRVKDKLVARFVSDVTFGPLRKKKCRLIIRNLSFQATERNVLDKLYRFGPLTEVEIPTDPFVDKKTGTEKQKPKGFAFVTFLCEKDAAEAVNNGQTLKICNRDVAIDYCISKAAFEKYGCEKKTDEEVTPDDEEEVNGEEFHEEDNDAEESSSCSESENESSVQQQQPKISSTTNRISDVKEGKTLFVHGISYDTTTASLESAFQVFGDVEIAILVKDKETGVSKGSAFVKFRNRESVQRFLDAQAAKGEENKNFFEVNSRKCFVSVAVSKNDLSALKAAKSLGKDKRNLYLANEGINPASYSEMLKQDKLKREKFQVEKKKKLQNPLFYISNTRLSIRNLSKKTTNHELKISCIKAVKKGLVERKLVGVEDLKNQIVAQGMDSPVDLSKLELPPFTPKHCVTSAKIMFDANKIRDGKPQSRGYAFVEFTDHIYALAALRELNNNPSYDKISAVNDNNSEDRGRLIVEFTVENTRKVKILKKRKLKSEQIKANDSMLNALESFDDSDIPVVSGSKRKSENEETGSSKRKKSKK